MAFCQDETRPCASEGIVRRGMLVTQADYGVCNQNEDVRGYSEGGALVSSWRNRQKQRENEPKNSPNEGLTARGRGGVATPAHGKREGPVGSKFRAERGTKITMGGYEGAQRLSPPRPRAVNPQE